MIPLPAVVFLAFTVVVCLVIEVWCMWARVDRLTDETAHLRHAIGLPEPQPEPRWWERAREWLRTVHGQDEPTLTGLAGFSDEPKTSPMPVVTADTVPSKAVVVGGARVVEKTAPSKAEDWVEDDLAAIRARTAKRTSEGVR